MYPFRSRTITGCIWLPGNEYWMAGPAGPCGPVGPVGPEFGLTHDNVPNPFVDNTYPLLPAVDGKVTVKSDGIFADVLIA